MQVSRRGLIGAGLACGALWPGLTGLAAQSGDLFAIVGDDGKPVPNYRVPSQLSIDGLAGVIWAGARNGDVLIVEFHDFNCGYCRRAAADIDALLRKDRNIRLALVNNASLSIGSVQAAKVEQAVLRFHGPVRAYEFHRRLFALRGVKDGPAALRLVQEMGLDRGKIEAEADSPLIGSVLKRQRALADALAFNVTPAFIIGSAGILGYPGPRTLARMVTDMRKCDKPKC